MNANGREINSSKMKCLFIYSKVFALARAVALSLVLHCIIKHLFSPINLSPICIYVHAVYLVVGQHWIVF